MSKVALQDKYLQPKHFTALKTVEISPNFKPGRCCPIQNHDLKTGGLSTELACFLK